MAITDDRVVPLMEVRTYLPGQGDPLVIDRGWHWYDVLRESAHLGSVNKTAEGNAKLEWLPDVGLVNRPFLNLQDTRLTQVSTSGGTWEERIPGTGNPNKYRLMQLDTTADVQWSATSSYKLPKNPHVAFSLVIPDTPPNHDSATYPPFVRLELGGQKWAVELSKVYGARLLLKVGSDWEAVQELPEPTRFGNRDSDEMLLMLRHYRGRICISTDFGKTYTQFGYPDGTAATINSTSWTIRGQGGQVLVGLHQLQYVDGVYTSPTKNTFTSRPLSSATLTGRYYAPGTTAVTFADVGTPASGIARYTATLEAQTITGTPFDFFQGPELYAVLLTYPVVRQVTLGTYTTEWTGAVRSADLDYPLDLSGATATLRLRRDAQAQLTGDYRWRKVVIINGYQTEAGSAVPVTGFVGYVRSQTAEQGEYNKQDLIVTLDNPTIRFKRTEWDDFARPLGGLTVNAALDYVLASEGLDTTNRVWWYTGDLITLPEGSPEDPAFWPRRGERKWETLERIARYAGLELAVFEDSGDFFTVPRNFVQPYTSKVWDCELASGALVDAVQRLSHGVDAGESVT
ncbi:MAG: hypothetical protein ACO1SX_00225, partial [Actinomycetota bacterium]